MTREEILKKAREAQDHVAQAAQAVEGFVRQAQDVSAAATSGAARAQQEAVGHLINALSLLNQVGARPATADDFPHCMRCDKPVDRIGLAPRSDNPEVIFVEFECHHEVVRQEVSAATVEGGLSRYSAFNAYTSGLMPMSPDERN